jgi:hypothetical protein
MQAAGMPVSGMQMGGMPTGGMQMQMGGVPMAGMQMGGMPTGSIQMVGHPGHPGHPGHQVGMVGGAAGATEIDDMHERHEREEAVRPETRSQMPVPRFHPIPTQPVFQRSEGMTTTLQSQTLPPQQPVAATERRAMSEAELAAALDRAYLEGVSAAMDEIERKMEEQRLAVATARLQERILQQAESVQRQLDEQERTQLLAMQRSQHEHRLQEQHLKQLAMAEFVPESFIPKSPRVSPPGQTAVVQRPPPRPAVTRATNNVNAAQLAGNVAGNVRASITNGVNEVFGPLLNSSPREFASAAQVASAPSPVRLQAPVTSPPRAELARAELASMPPDLPGRPPVSPIPQEHGLLPNDEPHSFIRQAGFAADDVPIRP